MIDVNWSTTSFISASADSTVRLWDVETGREKHLYQLDTPSRACAFGFDGNVVFYTNDDVMGKPCEIHLADIRSRRKSNENKRTTQRILFVFQQAKDLLLVSMFLNEDFAK